MTAGGQQSGLVQRETVLKSHRLNAFSSPCVHQSVLEQDTEVFPAKFISYSAPFWHVTFFLTITFIDIVETWDAYVLILRILCLQVRPWSRCLSRVWARSRPSGSPVRRPPGWDLKRALCASTDRRWRPRWRPTRWKRWNLHGPSRWGAAI